VSGEDEIRAAIEAAKVVAFPRAREPESSAPEGPTLHTLTMEDFAASDGAGEARRDDAPSGAPDEPGHDDVSAGDGGTGAFDDRDKIVERMNGEWSFVLMGSRAVVMREMPNAPIEDRTRILSIDAFRAYHLNKGSTVRSLARDDSGEWVEKTSFVKWAPTWLASKHRHTFDGIEFFPDRDNAPGTPGYFNLWRGFSCKPDRDPPDARAKKYSVFRDHLLTNVCDGNKAYFEWLFAWCAHILQRPRERIGTAVVFRGKMGSGKTKVGEIVGSLFASHYFLVDDPRYLTGQFNAHMASCLLLQVDEGFWAGDKAAEGRLKGLVTSPKQMIEAKGVDPIRLDNFVRLMFSSNESWVIPAGHDERRFCVFDVAPYVAKNHGYFREMDEQIANGGREALLADLLALDLAAPDAPNLRVIPKTSALLEQKLRSFDSVTQWYFERLRDGALTRRAGQWNRTVSVDTLFDDYVHQAEKVGVRRKSEKTAFGMALHKLVAGLQVKRQTITEKDDHGYDVSRRAMAYVFPKLAECRALFSAYVEQDVPWFDDIDPGGDAAGAENGERETNGEF